MRYKTTNCVHFLKIETAVSGYMALYEKTFISLKELKTWMYFLNTEFNKKENRMIVLLSNEYLKEFKCEYSKYFKLEQHNIVLNKNITIEDVRKEICSYINVDVLLTMINSIEKFKYISNQKENKYEL